MKSAILLFTFYFSLGYLSAQDFQLQNWQAAYTPLDNPNVVIPSDDDDLVYLLNANFNFSAFGKSFPEKAFADGGVFFLNATYQNGIIISAHSTDWLARPDTKMSYTLEGNSGSKILKVEFANVGFYEEFSNLGTQHDYMNVQVWIYEDTKKVQYHYGASDYSKIDSLAQDFGVEFAGVIGISLIEGDVFLHNTIQGTDVNPILTVGNSENAPLFKGIPSDGTVFQLCPVGACTSSLSETAAFPFRVFPNPAINILTISSPDGLPSFDLKITDSYGRDLSILSANSNTLNVDISQYPAGMYFLNINEAGKQYSSSFVKLPE